MSDQIIEADDYKWYVGGPETDDHLALGGHETHLWPILKSMIAPNKSFVNIGAHVGLWALRMSEFCSWVYAIEANPYTFMKLDANIKLNKLTNITAIEAAIWDNSKDLLTLTDANDKLTGGSTRAEAVDYSADLVAVQAVRLDDLEFDVPIGLITMDVEGAEARVLTGALDWIMLDRPNMVIELHEGHPGTAPNLRQQVYDILDLLQYEYRSVEITGERLLCYPSEATALDDPVAA